MSTVMETKPDFDWRAAEGLPPEEPLPWPQVSFDTKLGERLSDFEFDHEKYAEYLHDRGLVDEEIEDLRVYFWIPAKMHWLKSYFYHTEDQPHSYFHYVKDKESGQDRPQISIELPRQRVLNDPQLSDEINDQLTDLSEYYITGKPLRSKKEAALGKLEKLTSFLGSTGIAVGTVIGTGINFVFNDPGPQKLIMESNITLSENLALLEGKFLAAIYASHVLSSILKTRREAKQAAEPAEETASILAPTVVAVESSLLAPANVPAVVNTVELN